MRGYETAISRAHGRGSTNNGFSHWWRQRITSVLLVPLLAWLAGGLALQAGADLESARAWVAFPLNATLLIVAMAVLFYHAALGVQVVIEDYVHLEGLKVASLMLLYLACFALVVAGSLAVVRIALGG